MKLVMLLAKMWAMQWVGLSVDSLEPMTVVRTVLPWGCEMAAQSVDSLESMTVVRTVLPWGCEMAAQSLGGLSVHESAQKSHTYLCRRIR